MGASARITSSQLFALWSTKKESLVEIIWKPWKQMVDKYASVKTKATKRLSTEEAGDFENMDVEGLGNNHFALSTKDMAKMSSRASSRRRRRSR